MNKLELLAPAGNFSKLKTAVYYGADAVYIGGKNFSLRAFSDNFTDEEIVEAVKFAHGKNVKIYVTVNIFAKNSDFEKTAEYFKFLERAKVDAVLITDVGLISLCKKVAPELKIHLSTQANTLNKYAVKFWGELGLERVVLARELSLSEIKEISEFNPETQLEAFVHGAMCVSFSGRCLISEYLTGRGANRGECAQPCRWGYYLMEEKRPNQFYKVFEDERGSYILNARDMCMIEHLDDLMEAGVTSFKIEGRAKSAYYVAMTVNAYRAAIDSFKRGEKPEPWIIDEVNKISHRPYSTGFFYGKPTDGSGTQDPSMVTNGGQFFDDSGYRRDSDFVGVVDGCADGIMHLTQRNYFTLEDELELVPPHQKPIPFAPAKMISSDGEEIAIARRATEKLTIPTDIVVPAHTILRKKIVPVK